MTQSWMSLAGVAGALCLLSVPAGAQTVMQQCGQQYQAAKTAGTLNGMTWTQYRTDCAARLKGTAATAEPAVPANPLKPAPVVVAPAPVPGPAPVVVATPAIVTAAPAVVTAAPASKAAAPMSGGRAAMLGREKQCGAEWRAQKVTLVAQTPGLTWPKYWSLCNARLKAAGQ